MRNKWIRTICVVLIQSTLGWAQSLNTTSIDTVPHLVRFNGTVKDDAGHPRAGVVGITFALYKDQQGGAPLWLETQNVKADSQGRYTVLLGLSKAEGLPADIFTSNEARWLGVQVEGQEEQLRTLLVSAPYALKAGDAETLGGKPLSAFQLARSQPADGTMTPGGLAAAEQANEVTCASGTACKSAFVPLFSSNGGSAKVADSIISQSGNALNVTGNLSLTGGVNASAGEVQGKFGFFQGSNLSDILTAVNTSSTSGIAIVGSADGSSGIGIEGNGVTGILGQGTTSTTGAGIGVMGTGVFGVQGVGINGVVALGQGRNGNNLGVYGQGGFGIWGVSTLTTNGAFGVQGSGSNSGVNYGVFGISDSPNGTGVLGINGKSTVGQNLIGCCRAGVWGDTSGAVFGDTALAGTADDARAIYLENNSTHVPTAIMTQDAPNQFALFAGGPGNFCTIDTNPAGAHLHCPGGTATIASVDAGQRQVALYGVQSPQHWFEDFGSGKLRAGAAFVTLDGTFAQTVNASSDYHVFLTPEGDCRGLYVSKKTPVGFEVRELGGGQSNVPFGYRMVALRRGFENVRLEDMTKRLAKANAPLPNAPYGPKFTTPRPLLVPSVSTQSHVATLPNRIAPQ